LKNPGVLASNARTSGTMDQWRQLFNSVHEIGPETLFHRDLIVVGTWFTGGRKKFG